MRTLSILAYVPVACQQTGARHATRTVRPRQPQYPLVSVFVSVFICGYIICAISAAENLRVISPRPSCRHLTARQPALADHFGSRASEMETSPTMMTSADSSVTADANHRGPMSRKTSDARFGELERSGEGAHARHCTSRHALEEAGDDTCAGPAPASAMNPKTAPAGKSGRAYCGVDDASAATTPPTAATASPITTPQIRRARRIVRDHGVTVTFTSEVVQQQTSPPPPEPE